MSEWIKVSERFPPRDMLVLVYQDIWGRSIMHWNGLNWRADHEGDTFPPTHWMPLPASPNVK